MASPLRAPAPDPTDTGPHVLILDDSDFDRSRIGRLLKAIDATMTVHEASSTHELCTLLDKRVYDVMFLDYRLPDGDGSEALALVRYHRLNSSCPTIMIAGDSFLDAGGQIMHDKCDGYLAKADLSGPRLRESLAAAVIRGAHDQDYVPEQDEPGYATPPQATPEADLLRIALDDNFAIIRGLHALRHYPAHDLSTMEGDLAEIERRAIRQWSAMRRALAARDGSVQLLHLAADNDWHSPSR